MTWRGAGLSVCVGMRPEQTGPMRSNGRTLQPSGSKASGVPRDQLWAWLRARYELLLPDAELCVADTDDESFSRSAARNAAVRLAGRELLLIADADTVFDVDQLARGVAAVGRRHVGICDRAHWVTPYRRYVQLLARDTHQLVRQPPDVDVPVPRRLQHDTNTGTAGLLLVTADAWARVGGYDERFDGWGYEDTALTMTLETLVHGCVRTDGVAVHLCHPKSARRRAQLVENRQLFGRYQQAHYHPALMCELIDERAAQ